MEHHPAPIRITLDAPRQCDMTLFETPHHLIEILHRQGKERETIGIGVLSWGRSPFEDGQINSIDPEMRPWSMLRQKLQSQHITVEMHGCSYFFSPYRNDSELC